MTLRKAGDEVVYRLALGSGQSKELIDEPRLMEWKYWALIDNKYPYTAAFKIHHLLIPKRAVAEKMLHENEKKELQIIFDQLGDLYDCRLVNFKHKQTKQSHFHIHLLTYKDNRSNTGF